MSESLITKKALAASIKQLMEKAPLAKISIQEIVDNCGLNRQTFYYHFKDKFDLVNWIYYIEATESIADCRHYENWADGMYRTLSYLIKNKSFYINAINTPGQNSFEDYFFQFNLELVTVVVDEMSSDISVSNENKKFIADFYTHAFVDTIVKWVKKGMKEPPQAMVDKVKSVVEGSMLGALLRNRDGL